MAPRAGHKPKRVRERRRDGENQKQLQEICERRWIFEGVRAVGTKETAAIGSKHLDRFLRSDRPLRDELLGDRLRGGLAIVAGGGDLLWLNECGLVVGPQVLHHSLRDKNERHDKADRQEYPKKAASEIHPKVSDA